jgi:hypothetical protein
MLIAESGNNLRLQARSSQDVEIWSGGVKSMTIDSTGNVGIGTNNPTSKLQIGDATVSSDNKLTFGKAEVSTQNYLPVIQHASADGVSNDLVLAATSGTGRLRFFTGGGIVSGSYGTDLNKERMTIDSTGKVGIGTSSPSSPMHVRSTLGNILRLEQKASGTPANYISFNDTGGRTGYVGFGSGSSDVMYITNDTATGDIRLSTQGATRMTIDHNGNCGIGTANPDTKLHVYTGNSGATPHSYSKLNVEHNTHAGISIMTPNNKIGYLMFADPQNTNAASINYNHAADKLTFKVNGGSRVVFDSAGKVGIGTLTPYAKLHVIGDTRVSGYMSSKTHLYGGLADATGTPTSSTTSTIMKLYGGNYGHYTTVRSSSTTSNSTRVFEAVVSNGTKIRFTAAGNGYWDGTGDSGSADYAEYFEWTDGNPNNEDRVGYSVTLVGNQMKIAEEGDVLFGIVSARPAIVGDTASLGWQGKYEIDEFGRRIQQDITVYSWTDEDGEEVSYRQDSLPEGITVPDDATSKVSQEDKLSAEYDVSAEADYLPRSERKEWSPVGLMGKLKLRTGQVTDSRWVKMRDMSDTIEEWLVR